MKSNVYSAFLCGLALLTFGCATAPEQTTEAPAEAPAPETVQEQAAPSSKASVTSKYFAKNKLGQTVTQYTLKGAGGVVMDVINYGGKVVRLYLPDKNGEAKDCTLGFNDVAGYENVDHYFGSIIGRYGNRIAEGLFVLDGVTYRQPTNNEPGGIPCCLHGGLEGWDAKIWDAEPFQNGDTVGVVFKVTSPDGDQGFPGKVEAQVTYTLTPDNVWRIEYQAVPDKATPINLTQHIYFNFHGEAEGTILDHDLTLFADKMTPVDAGLIPTGEITPVAGTPFDFTTPHKIGERVDTKGDKQLEYGNGYDHNFVLTNPSKDGQPVKAAALYEEKSGRYLEIWTTEPGIQFYCGNFLTSEMIGKQGKPYQFRGGLALETQHYPDSPNQPNFPSTIVRPGETYKSVTEYHFGVK
jgi:aldose 1-epimerase